MEILKAFYGLLGSEKQSEVEVETMNASIPTGNNRIFMAEVEVQNDDLVEADRSHLEVELEDQEGAVGGILEGSAQVMCHICICKYLNLNSVESCNVTLTIFITHMIYFRSLPRTPRILLLIFLLTRR